MKNVKYGKKHIPVSVKLTFIFIHLLVKLLAYFLTQACEKNVICSIILYFSFPLPHPLQTSLDKSLRN